ncbi:MAG: ABC transporter ATP-binding protein [Candidatus Neomarinimicrobiota bacterium]
MEASITLKKVGKLFNERTILAGLTFGIEKGSLVAVIGDSDSEKSMLLRILAGFDTPEYGSVYIHGTDISSQKKDIRQKIGFVPQESDLEPWLTVRQNIQFIGALYHVDKRTRSKRIENIGDQLELHGDLDTPVIRLTKGVLKRAMLLRALIHDPSILILDDPSSSLDPGSKELIWNVLGRLRGSKTIVYVSKSYSEVEKYHDRILLLEEGKVVVDGNIEKLRKSAEGLHRFSFEFENPSKTLVTRLMAIPNLISSEMQGNNFVCYGTDLMIISKILDIANKTTLNNIDINKFGLPEIVESRKLQEFEE